MKLTESSSNNTKCLMYTAASIYTTDFLSFYEYLYHVQKSATLLSSLTDISISPVFEQICIYVSLGVNRVYIQTESN